MSINSLKKLLACSFFSYAVLRPPIVLLLFSIGQLAVSLAQTPPITSSGHNTQITQAGLARYDITGGTRPGGGANLFHSFGEFSVPENNIASFLNETGLPTSSILARVTEGNISNIFGSIQTSGFGNANLFLINPAGFLFGPNATINVGGLMTFTSADYLKLADGVRFNAMPDIVADGLLSASPVATFGFLGQNPGAITVQGSQFIMAEGTGISLVGGNITVEEGTPEGGTLEPARLSAPGGQITLVSVTSLGEVTASNFLPAPDMAMGTINLSKGSTLDVSADTAGTVRIRGGQFVIDEATILADTGKTNGAPVAIDINVVGNMSLANEESPALTARTNETGNAGTINIRSGNLEAITSSSDSLLALIDTRTAGTGTAGSVSITTTKLQATNENFFIDTGSAGTGHGGDVSIVGTNILIEGPVIATGNFRFGQLLGLDVTGSAGHLTMQAAENLEIGPASTISTEAWSARAGDMTLQAHNINITGNSFVSVDGDFGGATIRVTADQLTVGDASQLNNNTVVDAGGDISINTRILELGNGGFIQTSTMGEGPAGKIVITSKERIKLDDEGNIFARPSGLVSTTFGDFVSFGNSGAINVTTPLLEIVGGAQINTSTRTSGAAGDITITTQNISISGERPFETPESFLEIGSTRSSGIYTRTVGNELCSGPCGNAGNVSITSGFLNLRSGGTINSGTSNAGAGGIIVINSANAITLSGTMVDGTPSSIFSRSVGTAPDSSAGGNISLTARQAISVSDGAAVSASSTGPGNAGNVSINAGQQLDVQNSSITTQADQASGGNIDIRAIDRVRLINSEISASVQGGPNTAGGNITIDPKVVVLQDNSKVTAQAVQGAEGTSQSLRLSS